jgi:phospholipid/cholesterol/gamma-HCH transport system substrate-binding protein
MAQRRSLAWTELKVGLLVIVGFAVLAFAIIRIGGPTSIFGQKMRITAFFPSANGLRSGAEVWLDGILVGNVDDIRMNMQPGKGRVAVVMSIDKKYEPNIRSDSPISIDTIGLLGDKNIQMGTGTEKGTPVGDGGELKGADVGDIRRIIQGTDDLVANLNVLTDKFASISENIDRGEGTLGKLLTKSEIHDNLNKTVLEMQHLVEDVRSGPGTAGRFISDDEMYERFTSVLARMDDIVAKMERGEGTAGKFLNDPALYDRFEQLFTKMDSIAGRIERGEGSLGKLIKDDAFTNDLHDTLTQMNNLVSAIQNGDGTAGKLIKDPTLFNSMNDTVSQIQKLLYDFQHDPKKYLTINFKLF